MTGTTTSPAALVDRLEDHRVELTGFCYRMLGSPYEAEDAVQDTMVRAWRGLAGFDGRSSLRSWLYRIATNVCFDALAGRGRRALPVDLAAVSSAAPDMTLGARLPESAFVEPMPDSRTVPAVADPAELAVLRESVRLAFLAALQHLPPRQRAVLILRDVLRWRASEVASLLDTTVASVNSALQRARATLPAADREPAPLGEQDAELLERYVAAFESFDIDGLVALLAEDATHMMPPYDMWLRGRADIAVWLRGPGAGCRGSRLVPVRANGGAGYAQYKADGLPFSIQVVSVAGGRITSIAHCLDTRLYRVFGLPDRSP